MAKRSMPVSELVAALGETRMIGAPPAAIGGIAADSRKVAPGDCFVAVPGFKQDARRFVPEAIARGAAVIVTEGPPVGDVDVAQIYDGFSASVIYGLESYGFCKEGEALDFIQDGRIELHGELPLNTFGGSLSTGRIHGLWHIIEGALQASGRAGERQVEDVHALTAGGC